MKLSDFDYNLPREFIAQTPIKERDKSKLLVYNNGKIEHKQFYEITEYLKKGDVLVLNDTKVVPAKIVGKKSTGAKCQIILLSKIKDEYKARVQTSKPRVGNKILFDENVYCEITKQEEDIFFVKFNKNITDFLVKHGKLPLPGYIKEELKECERYQTVYSSKEGSLAAPTAGLHFTNDLIKKLEKKGVIIAKVCLHVGFGTFLPVRVDDITKHKMHEEYYEVTKETADLINNRKGRLFIVGTTSLRTLESACDQNGLVHEKTGFTELFVYPGYEFKLKFDGIITNFHLPKSTLLMLISAIIGRKKLMEIYEIAKENKYRFYSLGDAMLIFRTEKI